ncbi:MAG TPA: hypothetical protein VKP65_16685 [Rhodothermales bacterium]|nr:hypothetical protein [Rhodothermales bacterium]
MPSLTIRLTKKPDGTSVLVCTRPNGSATWQRHRGAFFPLHDLTHYAVETVLRLRFGFYGLLAHGWHITDFGERAIPAEAQADATLAEAVVGLMDQERATGIVPDTKDFNEMLAAVYQELGVPLDRSLTEDTLQTIRARFTDLAGRWKQVEPGGTLELPFEILPVAGT